MCHEVQPLRPPTVGAWLFAWSRGEGETPLCVVGSGGLSFFLACALASVKYAATTSAAKVSAIDLMGTLRLKVRNEYSPLAVPTRSAIVNI